MRGINSNKASPDSGWTFPGLVNSQIFPGVITNPTGNFVNGNGMLPGYNNDLRGLSANFVRDSNMYHNVLSDSYQTKVLTPFVEMNLRQQQQLFENAMFSQTGNNGHSNINPLKVIGASPAAAESLQHSNYTSLLQAKSSNSSLSMSSNPALSMSRDMQSNSSQFIQGFPTTINNNDRMSRLDDWQAGPKITPLNTPVAEVKPFQDPLIQPYINLSSSVTNVSSPQMQAALAAAQMNNYFSSLRQSNFGISTSQENFQLMNNNGLLTVDTKAQSLQHVQKTGCKSSESLITKQEKAASIDEYHENKGERKISLQQASLPRLNALGSLKASDPPRSHPNIPPFGYDPGLFQASSRSVALTYNTTYSTTVIGDGPGDKSPPHPIRPNHLGSSFVPQTTQFLSVNVNHGSAGSDKESIQSSTSPGHVSPYSSGRRSRTPSPRSDKFKCRNDNTCSQCGKQFSSSSALAKHKLIHSDERKYVCHICSRGFKRQDHLNGHMITHRDKKPYECHFSDCGKSYCDMRSLKRHLENHHSSPPGGATPAGYMPKLMSLYPGYHEEDAKRPTQRSYQQEVGSSRLTVPTEPPRPSSAPLVPPEPKRVNRNRRSSSGEETGLQIDPSILREIEARRALPYVRHEQEVSDEYVNSCDEHLPHSLPPPQASPTSSRLLTTAPVGGTRPIASDYDYRKEYDMKRTEYERRIEENKRHAEYDHHNPHRELKQTHSGERLYKEYENSAKKFSPAGLPSSAYPAAVQSHLMNPRFPWGLQYATSQPGPSPGSANMPFLLNIRNPFAFPPHGLYPGQNETSSAESTKVSKSEIEARQQAYNTYLQMWANGQHGSLTPEQLFVQSQGRLLPAQNIPTPTDPTAIAIAAAKESNDRPPFNVHDGLYGIHPTNAQWQPVMQDDSVTREKDPKSSYFHHPPSSSVHDTYLKRPSSCESAHRYPNQERNIIDEPFKPSESNHYRYSRSPWGQYYDRSRVTEHPQSHDQAVTFERVPSERSTHPRSLEPVRHLDISRSPHHFDHLNVTTHRETATKIFEPPHLRVDTNDSLVASALSPSKKRPRPGPIIIPPAVNSRSLPGSTSPMKNFPRGIYTPPAMLSPKSIFFNPPGTAPRAPVPSTPGRMLLGLRRSTSVHQRETPLSTSVSSDEQVQTGVQEPKINVGPRFQAVLPAVLDRSEAQKDIHRASLMWSPLKEDEQKYEEVNAYLGMACSLALYGGSNNKEYALHILQRTRGNVKEAVRLLLSRRHILRADDPNADYHYSGSVRWTAKERLSFRQAYRTKGKVFGDIQKEVVTKSVHLCIEFYYLWKAMHPESFRARTRMVEVESEQDDEEVPPTPTAAVAPLSTLREPVFECDYPECRARFVSRQALNGHIRVHGGSFSKPPETRRPKQKGTDMTSPGMTGVVIPSPPKKKRATTPSSVIVTNTSEGPQLQFQCKVCGRVFSKVKSRSAHMKTHVKRDENNKPIKTPKNQQQRQ